jgi:arginine decarboxylase
VLIVDSGLAGADTAARRVRALADELGARNIAVTESVTYDDGLATVVSDTSIHCILLNWTQSGNDAQAIGEATELLRTVRKRNAKIPIFLMASRALAGTLSVEVMTLADEFIWILDDTATFISGRVQGAVERYAQTLLPPYFAALDALRPRKGVFLGRARSPGRHGVLKSPVGRVFFDFLRREHLFAPTWASSAALSAPC